MAKVKEFLSTLAAVVTFALLLTLIVFADRLLHAK